MLIQRYHCNCYGYKEKGDCKSLTTKQMCDYRLKRKLWNIKQIENLRTIQQYNNNNNNNKRKAKWDTTYLRAKDTVCTTELQKLQCNCNILEANVKAKRKSNKEPIYNWNDNGRYNVDDSKRDENDQQKNSSSKQQKTL